jgi:hypothetical protein
MDAERLISAAEDRIAEQVAALDRADAEGSLAQAAESLPPLEEQFASLRAQRK